MDLVDLSLVTSVSSSRASVDENGSSLTPELEMQVLMSSESFYNCLQLMERVILANIFQPKFSSYRLLHKVKGKPEHTTYILLTHAQGFYLTVSFYCLHQI